MAEKAKKVCEECESRTAIRRQRLCAICKKRWIREMEACGYLERRPRGRKYRGKEKREERNSEPSPWQENAIRFMEGD